MLYLYPKYDWKNVEHAKQKLKIVKKNRKEEENKARKVKEKQERLKKVSRAKEETKEEVDIEKQE